MSDLTAKLAEEFKLPADHAEQLLALFKDGYAIAFLARYRRDKLCGLNEAKLRELEARFNTRAALEARRTVVLSSLKATEKLDDAVKAKVEAATSREELEDIFLPFTPREKTPAQKAQEQGLEPLAEKILKQDETSGTPEEAAAAFLNAEKGLTEAGLALVGARALLAERWGESVEIRSAARKLMQEEGRIVTAAKNGQDLAKTRFAALSNYSEALAKAPANKVLAALRGETDGKLTVKLEPPREKLSELLLSRSPLKTDSIWAGELKKAMDEALDWFILPLLEKECREKLKSKTDDVATESYGKVLRSLLLAPPLGQRVVLAIAADPRGGARIAIVAGDGKVLAHAPLVLGPEPEKRTQALEAFLNLVKEHKVEVVAISSGAATKEADLFVREALASAGLNEQITRTPVDDAGAAAFAASRLANKEFKEFDGGTRAAVFLGRRLQDPLYELCKHEPRAICGQDISEIDPATLRRKTEEVFEQVVAQVGVDVNRAPLPLLFHVPGLGQRFAQILDAKRNKTPLATREELKTLVDPKAFEQSAPFLRIPKGTEALDATALHPERYELAKKLATSASLEAGALIGNHEALAKLDLKALATPEASEDVLKEVIGELKRGAQDPRGTYVPPKLNEDVRDVADLKEGQILTGIVVNLTPFGAFVELGLHQEGLVHISEISHRFLRDPSDAIKIGQVVKVKVLHLDADRRRIGLSIKQLEAPPQRRERPAKPTGQGAPREARAPRAPREGRPPRGPRPGAQGAPQAGAAPAGAPGSAPAAAGAGAPPQGRGGSRPPRGPRKEGAPRKDGPRGPRKEGDAAPRGPRMGPNGKPLPDFSKFFVKGGNKRKDKRKDDVRSDANAASRDEVKQTMRDQTKRSSSTLGDLLKKAGFDEKESGE